MISSHNERFARQLARAVLDNDLVNGRQCEDCHVCCVALELPPRAAHTRCHFLNQRGQCLKYATRPRECSLYWCMWRLGQFRQEDRPDRSGVIVSVVKNSLHGIGANIVECTSEALKRSGHIIEACRGLSFTLIKVVHIDGTCDLISTDRKWIERLRQTNPGIPIPEDASHVELRCHEDTPVRNNGGRVPAVPHD